GGLVGYNAGTVSASSAVSNISLGTSVTAVGGLVGLNDVGGSIVQSKASGTVTGGGGGTGITPASLNEALFLATCDGCSQDLGGLVGENAGSIVESSASTTVSDGGT